MLAAPVSDRDRLHWSVVDGQPPNPSQGNDASAAGGETDEQVLARLVAGDRSALDELHRRYWQAIWRFAGNYLGDELLAEDVCQETLAKLLTVEDLPAGLVKPWLYKVARNRCLDILRRHQRSPTHNRPIRTGFDAAAGTTGAHTRYVRGERQALMRDVIAQMPEDYRSVLMLKHFENMTREEMAETLGVSEATIKGRLVRASEYLREQLRNITGSQS